MCIVVELSQLKSLQKKIGRGRLEVLMKIEILFLALLALTACETTNIHPTKVVEVQTVEVTKIDCESIDDSFKQIGDTCVSICVACIKGSGQCLDTDKNGYGDTCVTPEPTSEPMCTPGIEICNNVDDDCDGEIDENERFWYVDLDHDGFGDIGKPVVAGCVPPTVGPWLVLNDEDCNDADASISPTTADLCDGKDNNCDGYTDESFGMIGTNCQMGIGECAVPDSINVCTADGSGTVCSKPAGTPKTEVCGDSKDNDCDGATDEECDCSYVNSGKSASNPGFANWCNKCTAECKLLPDIEVTKDSYKLVVVFGTTTSDWPYKDGFIYEFGNSLKEIEFSKSKSYSDWSGASFVHDTFVAIDLDLTKKFVSFNANEYPGKWKLCSGTVIDKIAMQLTLPDVYIIKDGVWTKVNDQIETLMANDLVMIQSPIPYGGSGYSQPLMCAAMLKL